MHSITIVSILAAAGLASAAPSAARRSAYYVCGNNGFRGDCSVDPCALPWCPDYQVGTYTPVGWPHVDDTTTTVPIHPPTPTPNADPSICPVGTGYFQVCASNGFRGCCKSDACGAAWCADYKPGTYEPKHTWEVRRSPGWTDPTVCAAGTGYFQSCASNGFRGCCKSDACGAAWCPDYKPGTYEPKTGGEPKPPVTPPTPSPQPNADPTVCPAGKGFFQSCASNGFRGCCKTDACGAAWCADYKYGTYEPATGSGSANPVVKPVPTPTPAGKPAGWTDPTVCPAGTGYYQVCASGFKGCCKADACTLGYCPY